MTYRERREKRAQKLQGWAEKRQDKADATLASIDPDPRKHDWAFISQPGHIPARARMNAAQDRAYASLNKAASMESRAAGILDQAEHAIYSDDTDAVERIEERIAELEAKRERIKTVNAQLRAAAKKGDNATNDVLATLTDAEYRALKMVATYQGYYDPLHKGHPPYVLANLSGNIKRQRDRLPGLRQLAEQRELVRLTLAPEEAD